MKFYLKEAESALDYARYFADLPLREGSVKNRDGVIDELGRMTGYPAPSDPKKAGLPYCAIGTCACFLLFQHQHEGTGRGFMLTASSQAIRRYFEAKEKGEPGQWFSRDPQKLLEWQGAVGGWTNPGDSAHGHVFPIEGRLTRKAASGLVVTGIRTIEFNSDLSGDRDGQGCFRLTRRRLVNRTWKVESAQKKLVGLPRDLWFCNTSRFKGGAWWTD